MADQDRERLLSQSKQEEEMISRRGAETQRIRENEIGTKVIEAAIEVHRALGPGLFESVYEAVLSHELTERGLKVARQVPVAIEYKGIKFDEGFRADLIVEDLEEQPLCASAPLRETIPDSQTQADMQ